jgi:hypothetical protein
MKCSDIQELFGVYWDLPNDDLRRVAVDKHVKHCASCAEEFQIWEESTILIRNIAEHDDMPEYTPPISQKVMNRIYEDESWRIPVPDRIYAISFKQRRNLTVVIAACLALFVFSFLFSIVYQGSPEATMQADSSIFQLQAPQALPTATVKASMNGHNMKSAVASLNPTFVDPLGFNVGLIHSYPHYLLVLSLLGLTCTMLIMNWLSRTKV